MSLQRWQMALSKVEDNTSRTSVTQRIVDCPSPRASGWQRPRRSTGSVPRICSHLTAGCCCMKSGALDALPAAIAVAAGIVDTTAVSSNDYDPRVQDVIDGRPDAWFSTPVQGFVAPIFETS